MSWTGLLKVSASLAIRIVSLFLSRNLCASSVFECLAPELVICRWRLPVHSQLPRPEIITEKQELPTSVIHNFSFVILIRKGYAFLWLFSPVYCEPWWVSSKLLSALVVLGCLMFKALLYRRKGRWLSGSYSLLYCTLQVCRKVGVCTLVNNCDFSSCVWPQPSFVFCFLNFPRPRLPRASGMAKPRIEVVEKIKRKKRDAACNGNASNPST